MQRQESHSNSPELKTAWPLIKKEKKKKFKDHNNYNNFFQPLFHIHGLTIFSSTIYSLVHQSGSKVLAYKDVVLNYLPNKNEKKERPASMT